MESAIAEKIEKLNQSLDDSTPDAARLYYKGKVLVADAKPEPGFDFNSFIHTVREERIQELGEL